MNRKFWNFSEYPLRGSQNRCFALPNFSFGKTTLNFDIQQNFPFALQSRVNPHACLEVLPLTLQSEIGKLRIISLIKGNLKN